MLQEDNRPDDNSSTDDTVTNENGAAMQAGPEDIEALSSELDSALERMVKFFRMLDSDHDSEADNAFRLLRTGIKKVQSIQERMKAAGDESQSKLTFGTLIDAAMTGGGSAEGLQEALALNEQFKANEEALLAQVENYVFLYEQELAREARELVQDGALSKDNVNNLKKLLADMGLVADQIGASYEKFLDAYGGGGLKAFSPDSAEMIAQMIAVQPEMRHGIIPPPKNGGRIPLVDDVLKRAFNIPLNIQELNFMRRTIPMLTETIIDQQNALSGHNATMATLDRLPGLLHELKVISTIVDAAQKGDMVSAEDHNKLLDVVADMREQHKQDEEARAEERARQDEEIEELLAKNIQLKAERNDLKVDLHRYKEAMTQKQLKGVKEQKKKGKDAGATGADSATIVSLQEEVATLKGRLSASEDDVRHYEDQVRQLEEQAEDLKKKATPRDKIIKGLEERLKDAETFYNGRIQELETSLILQNTALASARADRDQAQQDSKTYLLQRNEMEAEVGVWQKRATLSIGSVFTAAAVGFGISQLGVTLPMAISGAKQNILFAFTYPAVVLALGIWGARSKMKSNPGFTGGKKAAVAALGAMQFILIGTGGINIANYGIIAHAKALEQSRCPEGGCITPKPPEQDCKVDFSESVDNGRRVAKITMPSNDRCYSVMHGNSYTYVIAGPPLPTPAK